MSNTNPNIDEMVVAADELQSLTPTSPMESNWPAKLTTWFRDTGEDEYQFFIRDGDCWREVARFTESEIGSMLATGMFDQHPNALKMLKDIGEMEAAKNA